MNRGAGWQRIVEVAADLLGPKSDRGSVDVEYMRAIHEMTADLLGVPYEERAHVVWLVEQVCER